VLCFSALFHGVSGRQPGCARIGRLTLKLGCRRNRRSYCHGAGLLCTTRALDLFATVSLADRFRFANPDGYPGGLVSLPQGGEVRANEFLLMLDDISGYKSGAISLS
jgi:hypothetical protein